MTYNTRTDVPFGGAHRGKMVAKHYDCHSITPKEINGEIKFPPPKFPPKLHPNVQRNKK